MIHGQPTFDAVTQWLLPRFMYEFTYLNVYCRIKSWSHQPEDALHEVLYCRCWAAVMCLSLSHSSSTKIFLSMSVKQTLPTIHQSSLLPSWLDSSFVVMSTIAADDRHWRWLLHFLSPWQKTPQGCLCLRHGQCLVAQRVWHSQCCACMPINKSYIKCNNYVQYIGSM